MCRYCYKDLPNLLKDAALRAAAQKELDNVEYEFEKLSIPMNPGSIVRREIVRLPSGNISRPAAKKMILIQVKMSGKLKISRTYLFRIEDDRGA